MLAPLAAVLILFLCSVVAHPLLLAVVPPKSFSLEGLILAHRASVND